MYSWTCKQVKVFCKVHVDMSMQAYSFRSDILVRSVQLDSL